MNRRDFSKISASGFMYFLMEERSAWGTSARAERSKASSRDAYARREGMTWIIGSSKVEQRVSLRDGRFFLESHQNKQTGHEYRDHGTPPDQVRIRVGELDTSTPMWHWNFVRDHIEPLSQGELQLDVRLSGGPIEVTKHWVVYPETAIIREWLTIENVSATDVRLQNLFFLNTRLLGGSLDQLELAYVTGGANYNGSQLLKTERLDSSYKRTFDSSSETLGPNYSAYLPLLLLRDLRSSDSLAVGWDYMGHCFLQVGDQKGGQVGVALEIAGYDAPLSPRGKLETPKAFTAALSGDLDHIGNQILDWQYQYLWEFTNPEYFGKTRWAVDWPDPWAPDGGTPSADNWGRRLSLDLRYVDLLRESGGDLLWDDAGWYDRWGDWHGPDWRLTTDYLRKHGMRWVLWMPSFLASAESKVAQEHPDWILPGRSAFEQSIPATRVWQKRMLDEGVAKWQDFQWRYDIAPAASASDTKLLAADQEFRALIQQFKESHPKSGVDACDGGGRWISYDLARFAESGEYTDGGVGPYSGYYTSLLVPPDKYHNVSDFDHTYYNAASDRVHLALSPTWYRDPGDGPDVESIRKDWEIYRYLVSRGVAGRWSHVFRPRVTGDDPIWYFQRMNASGSSGIIITKHAKTGSEYFLISKPISNTSEDHFEGGPTAMTRVMTTDAATLDTGIYADPVDGEFRYYGIPGEIYGPLNFRYHAQHGETSYITHIAKHGMTNRVNVRFFGMAFQTGTEPMTISALGQFDSGTSKGTYSLMLVRASDKAVLGSATLDMAQAKVDSLGFKYATLPTPIRLEPGMTEPVFLYPGGLQPNLEYDVRSYHSKVSLRQTGAQLMANGIALKSVPPGELLFLNLLDCPGSGINKTPPPSPLRVTKRRGTNLGTQGIEITWSPASDKNWVSFYEILKDGLLIGRCAKGSYFFDHSFEARNSIAKKYEVRRVDGDGNHSSLVVAEAISGEPEIHEPLGDFGPSQGHNGWRYEQSFDEQAYEELTWQNGGYEGFWAGSGVGRIGRIWAQSSANAEIARTFVAPRDCSMSLAGELQKDPSAESAFPVFARILHSQKQLWPPSGWASVPAFGDPLSFQVKNIRVAQGDVIRFVIKRNSDQRTLPVIWNPTIVIQEPS